MTEADDARRHRSTNLQPVALWLGVASVIGLAAFVYFRTFAYPYGWDTGYYAERIAALENYGQLTHRAGYIAISTVFHRVLGISVLTSQLLLPFLLLVIFAGMVALLIYRFTGRRSAFLASFAPLLLSGSYTYFAVSLYDNLLGLTLMVAALYLLTTIDDRRWTLRHVMLLTLLIAIAITHLETFLLTVGAIGIYLILVVEKQWRRFLPSLWSYRATITTLMVASATAVLHWRTIGLGIVKGYSVRPQLADASVTYALARVDTIGRFLADLGSYHARFINLSLYSFLFIIGVGLAVRAMRASQRRPAAAVFMAWLLVTYALFLFSILRGSVPISRASSLIPFWAFLIFGAIGVFTSFRRLWFGWAVVPFLLLLSVPDYVKSVTTQPPAIDRSIHTELAVLRQYVEGNGSPRRQFVVVVNTPSGEPAANAFFFMWDYWIRATLYYVRGLAYDYDYCVYFGNPVDVFHETYPTVRGDNPEYSNVSLFTTRCTKNLPKREVILIRPFAMAEFSFYEHDPRATIVTNDILSLPWSNESRAAP